MTEPASLMRLLEELGSVPGSRLREFSRYVTAVQRQRYQTGQSDRDHVAGSTALRVLNELDEDLRETLEHAGLNQKKLGSLLAIEDLPDPLGVEDAELDESLAIAIRSYLAAQPRGNVFGLRELAFAILETHEIHQQICFRIGSPPFDSTSTRRCRGSLPYRNLCG